MWSNQSYHFLHLPVCIGHGYWNHYILCTVGYIWCLLNNANRCSLLAWFQHPKCSLYIHYCRCTHSIVQSSMQKKKDAGDDDADHEYRDFMRVKVRALYFTSSSFTVRKYQRKLVHNSTFQDLALDPQSPSHVHKLCSYSLGAYSQFSFNLQYHWICLSIWPEVVIWPYKHRPEY